MSAIVPRRCRDRRELIPGPFGPALTVSGFGDFDGATERLLSRDGPGELNGVGSAATVRKPWLESMAETLSGKSMRAWVVERGMEQVSLPGQEGRYVNLRIIRRSVTTSLMTDIAHSPPAPVLLQAAQYRQVLR